MDESSQQDQEMTPVQAEKGNESELWLPSVLPPGQEMKDYLPKADPVGFKIPETENWDEESGGVSNGIPTVAPENSVTSHTTTQASDTRASNTFPGVCGLINMGNTCYMNAGLQCVYNIPGFCQHFFSVHDMEGKEENSPEWMRQQLEIQLSLLVRKYWCGQYQALHPKLFKQVLGVVHPQLNGFRQQDCQEFLALLLGSLQDNHAPSKTSHDRPSSRQQAANVSKPIDDDDDASSQQQDNGMSPLQQNDAMVATSHDDSTEATTTNNVSSDVSLSPQGVDDDTAMELSSPEEAKTASLDVVNEFQGILHNEVSCDVCGYMSTKEEPFLFLSLPLPHANERQIKIVWMPLNSRDNHCTRVLVNVMRNVTVVMVKEQLLTVLQLNDTLSSGSVLLAEVSSHHIHRVLSNDLAIKTVDDTKFDIYAFEMVTVGEAAMVQGSHDQSSVSHDQSSGSHDQFSGSHDQFSSSDGCQGWALSTRGHSEGTSMMGSVEYVGGYSTSWCLSSDDYDVEQGSPPAKLMKSEPISVVAEWHRCSICFEELLDTELKGCAHPGCEAAMCDTCLQASQAHYNDKQMQCPVCSKAVDFDKDFIPLATGEANQSNIIRLLQTNVMFRSVDSDGSIKCFGHPRIFYLATPNSGHDLYHTVQQSIPTLQGWGDMLNLHLTNETGCHCSRCDYTVKCTGCLISDEAPEVLLKPGDHVSITCYKQQYDEVLENVSEHVSMATEWDPVLKLQDCFQTFSQKEQLASDNSWYCCRCQANRPVTRILSIKKLPSTLIIHLKRFVFYGHEAIKVDTAVEFPMEFTGSDIYHGNVDDDDSTYKLVAAVCHFGVMGCGHYTAYTYNTLSNQWHYCNDETVTQQQPDSDKDSTHVYLLFYQSDKSSTSSLPDMVDLENCLHEERLSSEKLSKLFEVPPAPVSSPILKKSHSDGNLAAQNKPEVGMTTSLLNTMDLATSKGFERTTSLLDDYSNYDFDYDDTGGHGVDGVMTLSAKPLHIPDYLS